MSLFYNISGFDRAEFAFPVSADIFHAVIVQTEHCFGGVHHAEQVAVGRIHNAGVHAGIHRQHEERLVQQAAHRQSG